MRIVFLGTPYFAVPSLERLVCENYNVVAVITQPDRKSGRGYRLSPPAVKICAKQLGIPVLQFEKIRDTKNVNAVMDLNPDIIVTAAYGQILPPEILDIPKFGCINVHASLLPKYRGAAPVQWAIINGETSTGVTIMQMDEGLDTGDIISAKETVIGACETGGELYEKLANLGAQLLSETIEQIQNGTAKRKPQDEKQSSYYPSLSRGMSLIDWEKSAKDIVNLVRALNPIMGALASKSENSLKIWEARAVEGSAQPGSIVHADCKTGLVVGTGKGLLSIKELQAPCCKRMNVKQYLCGKTVNCDTFNICDGKISD